MQRKPFQIARKGGLSVTGRGDDLPRHGPRLDKQLLLKIFTEVYVRPSHRDIAKPATAELESEVSGIRPGQNRPPDDV
jgi:hypothetical protein